MTRKEIDASIIAMMMCLESVGSRLDDAEYEDAAFLLQQVVGEAQKVRWGIIHGTEDLTQIIPT